MKYKNLANACFYMYNIKTLTSCCMIRFESVRNRVTTRETRPGIAVKGMMKLIEETATIDAHGR